MTKRWWQCKVAGHPTQYELECRAYDKARDQAWYERSRRPFPGIKTWRREYLGEPVPMEIEHHTIPSRLVRDSSEG